MSAQSNHQGSLGPLLLRGSEQPSPTFRKSEQPAETVDSTEQIASRLFAEACERAGLTSKDIAAACGVSISLADKWQSPEQRGCPNAVQLLLLGADFYLEYHRALNRHFGWGRRILTGLLEGLSDLAMVVR